MDKKYVEIDEVRKCIDAVQSYREGLQLGALDLDADGVVIKISRRIENLPAADVAEVVRCKDCTFGKVDAEFDSVMCFCRNAPWDNKYVDYFVMSPLDYCSYGKKKEGATE